ncbi:MAG: hypothetical protein ACOC56_05245 [Atribacterota bacterium]
MGSNEKVFNAGELKFHNRLIKKSGETCSCGINCLECSFWKDIFRKNYNIYEQPNFSEKLKIIINTLLNRKTKISKEYEDKKLLSTILEKAKKDNSETEFILDTSKSLWRLNYLIIQDYLDIKVIYLQRDIQGNVSSFIKHKRGFIRGLLIYKLNNFLITKWLKINKDINSIKVNYKKLCQFSSKHLTRIGDFLNLNYTNYEKKVRNRQFHVPSGNKGARKQLLKKFNGLKYDNSWGKRLSRLELILLNLVCKNE